MTRKKPTTQFKQVHQKPSDILAAQAKEIDEAMKEVIKAGYYPKLEFLWNGENEADMRIIPMEVTNG